MKVVLTERFIRYMKSKNLFLKWAYNDTNRDFFKKNKNKINEQNAYSLNILNNVSVFIFGGFCIYSKVTPDIYNLFHIYFIYFFVFIIINLIVKHMNKHNYFISNKILYLIIAFIYAFGIYIGCFNIPNLASVMFPVFLICLPLVFIFPTIEVTIFNLIFIIIFIIISKIIKPAAISFIDQTNIIACFLISTVTSYTINYTRLKEIIATISLADACNTDELTKLHNRRSFNNFIVNMFNNSTKNLTLMMIDIDNFKDYNDSYGHIYGDNCLISISEIFKKYEAKYGCYIARYGGEEFVLVDYTHTLEESIDIAKDLIQTIFDMDMEHIKSYYQRITISIGIASKSPSIVSNYIDLINLADDALYQAKNNGKNTYMVATHATYVMYDID